MKQLAVHLGSFKVGELADADPPVFTYDPAWLQSAHPFPLSRQLPLRAEPFAGRPVRAFFAGLLPEADPRARIASIFGVSEENDFALLERLGGECAGAVSLRVAEARPAPGAAAPSLLRIDEARLAEIVRQLPQRPLLAGTEGIRLSLAGAQVKLPVVVDPHDGALALPMGDTTSTHILKPEPERFPGLAANEAFCMALARAAGISASCA